MIREIALECKHYLCQWNSSKGCRFRWKSVRSKTNNRTTSFWFLDFHGDLLLRPNSKKTLFSGPTWKSGSSSSERPVPNFPERIPPWSSPEAEYDRQNYVQRGISFYIFHQNFIFCRPLWIPNNWRHTAQHPWDSGWSPTSSSLWNSRKRSWSSRKWMRSIRFVFTWENWRWACSFSNTCCLEWQEQFKECHKPTIQHWLILTV